MPDPVVPSAARCVLTIQQSNGDVGVNVLHFSTATDALTLTQLSALADLVHTAWTTNVRGIQTSHDHIVHTRTQDLTSVPYTTFDSAFTSPGSDAGTELPKQVAAVGSVYTTHAGRRGRGRFYIGSLTESSITTGGALSSDTISAVNAFGGDLMVGSTSGSATFKLAVFSRKDGLVYDAVNVVCDSRADIQRRRANRRLF